MRFLVPIFILLVSCQQETKKISSEKIYFDLEKLVRADIERHTVNNCAEEKNITINGKNESKQIDTVDWEKELQLLLDCDINKPDWIGKYDVQVLNDSQKYIFTANSSKIPIRSLTVIYEQKGGEVSSVEIVKKISTALFSNEQQITFLPDKSFNIKACQSALFMKDFNSEVEIKYLCRK